MNRVRLALDMVIVLSTSLLVGVLAYNSLSGSDNRALAEIFLQSMHLGLLVGALLNLIHFAKGKQYLYLVLTALPLALFAVALAGMAWDFRFSNLWLLVFDFYLIFWFFYLAIREAEGLRAAKTLKNNGETKKV